MKVIDLLNKIANGEAPKTILYENETYWYDGRENNYYTYIARDLDDEDIEYLFCGENILDMLKDEIEIIEEDKKIEKIKDINTDFYIKEKGCETALTNEELVLDIQTLKHKINEIIDYLEEKE